MMLSALPNEEWLVHSLPFSPFGDMESEIAELRTLTKVTKLRQQIECRQEGAWLVVRDVPDLKTKTGTRKVTSYGRTSRSVSRSFSQNVSENSLTPDSINPIKVVIEHPAENENEKTNDANNSVEITEITDESSLNPPEITPQTQLPVKKTSIVTLGKGNLVLIDDEDSNFQVTGISKGRVADAVSTLERVAQGEKKVKKVGFSKTEVHFAPDSGTVNIVETDEKPPPSQMLRKKKKPRIKTNKPSDLPKLYFGSSFEEDVKNTSQFNNTQSQRGAFHTIREPSPLLTVSATAKVVENNIDKTENYGSVKKVSKPSCKPTHEDNSSLSYLGNISPRLSKLLQNNMQQEFQVKRKQIMQNNDSVEEIHQINVNVAGANEEKPVKIVTQVCLGEGKGKVEHKVVVKTSDKEVEPIYINKDVAEALNSKIVTSKPTNTFKEKIPKPKPRTTVVITPHPKEVRNTKLIKPLDKSSKRVTVKTRDVCKKECTQNKITKQNTKTINNNDKKNNKCELNSTNSKLQKLIKNGSPQEKPISEPRVRKTREPLRSFEKVSNGWVGHCITPVKGKMDSTPREVPSGSVSKVISNKTSVNSVSIQGTRRNNAMSGSKNLVRPRNDDKIRIKPSLSDNKQFSLSKEHLRSAKLVKELTQKDKQDDAIVHKKQSSNSSTSRIITSQNVGNRHLSKVGIAKPRISQRMDSFNKSTSVAVRIGMRRSEQSLIRQRRDSEQSDDSVVRADEEVRAYMFNSRHK